MPQIALNPFAPSIRIFKGDARCPRTVVVQQWNLPGGGGDKFIEATFFSTDKEKLDNASIGKNAAGLFTGVFTDGIAIGQTLNPFNGNFKNVFSFVLPSAIADIYARASYFNVTQQLQETDFQIFINVEAF